MSIFQHQINQNVLDKAVTFQSLLCTALDLISFPSLQEDTDVALQTPNISIVQFKRLPLFISLEKYISITYSVFGLRGINVQTLCFSVLVF